MTSKKLISSQNLSERRKQLQQRRKIEFWQATWRSLILTALSAAISGSFILPHWTIRQESQIEVRGDRYLSSAAIKELLDLSYPESILKLSPQKLIARLQANGPIEAATITRQLVPPRLRISVSDRPPVAIALSAQAQLDSASSYSKEIGFLDEKGIWMPKTSYKIMETNFPVPTLKVSGPRSHYLPHWQEIYWQIKEMSLEVYELNWQDPSNLILKTELGRVHFGAYTSQFGEQLAVLSQMQDLPNKIAKTRIDYINLQNPRSPKIKLHSVEI